VCDYRFKPKSSGLPASRTDIRLLGCDIAKFNLSLIFKAGQVRQHGLGDIVLGAKYRFFQETASLPMMAIYPVVVTTTGDPNKGLGNGGAQIFIPIWIQKNGGSSKVMEEGVLD
jgi:hypothetical protein